MSIVNWTDIRYKEHFNLSHEKYELQAWYTDDTGASVMSAIFRPIPTDADTHSLFKESISVHMEDESVDSIFDMEGENVVVCLRDELVSCRVVYVANLEVFNQWFWSVECNDEREI